MKFSVSLALIVFLGLVANGSTVPLRKRMAYYQSQPAQWYAAPQRMMYVHYVQPAASNGRRSTQAASALVAGEAVASGTYLQESHIDAASPIAADVPIAEAQQGEDILANSGAHAAHSFAEAYPEALVPSHADQPESVTARDDKVPTTVRIETASNDEAKVPREYNFESATPVPPTSFSLTSELPAIVPLAPIAPVVTPVRRYLPAKKKVYIELDQAAEVDETEDNEAGTDFAVAQGEADEEDETDLVPVPVTPKNTARYPIAKKPIKPVKAASNCVGCTKQSRPTKPLPAGTFFPIDFGGTNGGAIAIANSFSTGEGGSATSHAIAYGSPDAARARLRPSKTHH